MKKILFLFVFCNVFNSFMAQTYHEAITIRPNKIAEASNPNCVFMDATKTFNLPADGAFLYSSFDGEMGGASTGYNNNEDYVVTIKNQYGRTIYLKSHYFLTEDNNDVLEIYDGENTDAKLVKSVSGILDQNFLVVSSGEYLTLRFKSNGSSTQRGFRLRVDNGAGVANRPSSPLPVPMACASTPAANECNAAPLICDLNGYCGNTSNAYTAGNTSGLGNFCGSIENNSWLSFIASGTSASLAFNSAGCQDNGSGIQAVIYASSNCTSFTEVSNCESQGNGSGSFTITTNVNLVPGQTYYVMVDGFAGNVCSYTVGAQAGVALGQQITGANQICPGNSTVLGSSSTASSYAWTSTPPGTYPNTQTITVTPAVTTTYTLTLGASPCSPAGTTVVKTVTVTNTLNPANITAPPLVCYGSNVSLTSLTNGGTYVWTGPSGFNSGLQSPTINNWTAANNGTYSLTINYGGGCATTPTFINITGVAAPVVNLAVVPSATICAGQTLTFTASGGTGSNPAYTWNWPLGQSITLQTCTSIPFVGLQCINVPGLFPGLGSWGPKAVITPAVSGQICASFENATGCVGQKCVSYVVLPAAPALTISPTATICQGQSTTLTVSGGSSYTWSPAASLSSANGATVTANPNVTTVYTVSTTACGGTVITRTVQVVVNGTPPAIGSLNGPSPVCANSTGNTYSVTNVPGTNYTWSVPPGANITSTPTNSNVITVSFGAAAGTVSVNAVGTCGVASASLNVTLSPALNITITPSSTNMCSGTVTLTASGATNYTWSATPNLNTSVGPSIVDNPGATTIYTVTGATGGCTGVANATVTVGGALTLTVTPNTATVCAGSPTTLTASGATNYTWSPAASLNVSNGSVVIASPVTATTYTVYGSTGTCTGSVTATISMGAGLTLTLTSNTPTVCPGGAALLDVVGATTYTWSNAGTLSSPNGSNVTASPTSNTTYTVTGSTGGCTGTATISVGIGVCVSSACNLAQIRSTLTAAGNIELLGMDNTCSLYFLNPQSMTGSQAQAYAQTFGANLISVQSAAENADLVQALANQGYAASVIWIGFSDEVSEGNYVWYDGAPISYSNWAAGEPNNAGGDENCVQIYPDGGWNDLNCSLGNSLSVIEVNICPQVSVVNVPPIHCPNTNITMNASTLLGSPNYTYTWVQSGAETFTNTSTGSSLNDQITVTSVGANTFTVYTEDRYSCPQSTTVSLSVTATPSITVNSASICLGQQTATLTANGVDTYTWTPGLSATNGSVAQGNPIATQIYTVTGTDVNGCIAKNTSTITVNNLPVITANSASICLGQQTATLIAQGAATYSWIPGTGLNTTASATVLGTPISTESYTVLGIDTKGCISGTTATITVNQLPVIGVNSASICLGQQTATLTATGAVTYSWVPATGLNTTIGAVVTGTPGATQSYTVAGIDGNGCISGTVTSITVNQLPTMTVNSASICLGQQTATLTATGADSYNWSPGTGLSVTTGSVVTGTPSTNQTYTVTGTDINGCIGKITSTITINPLPIVNVSPNLTVCPLSANTLTVSGAASYTWSPNIYLNNNFSPNVISTPSVTTTYTVDGLTGACTASNVVTITVSNTVVVTPLPTSTTICPVSSTTLSASGATSYTWSPALTLNSANGNTVIASPQISTTYTVIGSTSTCTNSALVVVTVTNNPVISAVSDLPGICSGSSAVLTASGADTYVWSPAATLNSTTGATVSANPNNNTTYNVIGTTALGCSSFTTITLPVVATPTISINASPLTICDGKTTNLAAFGAQSYTWAPGALVSDPLSNPTTATPANVGINTFTVYGSNSLGLTTCITPATVQITVIANTTLSVAESPTICAGKSTIIYVTGGDTYTWTPTIGVISPNESSTTVYPAATTIYTVTASNGGLCPSTGTIEVVVNPLPIVNAGADTTINIDNTVVLIGTGDVPVGFLSPANGVPLGCNYCYSITVNPQDNTCYTLEGINEYGCRNTDEVCVTVTKDWDVFIPNAFTPNSDIHNEVFVPMGYGIDKIDLSIFDRWGHLIFKSNAENIGWDGKNKGKLCEQGVYIYQAEITAMSGAKVKRTGHVTLLSKVK